MNDSTSWIPVFDVIDKTVSPVAEKLTNFASLSLTPNDINICVQIVRYTVLIQIDFLYKVKIIATEWMK